MPHSRTRSPGARLLSRRCIGRRCLPATAGRGLCCEGDRFLFTASRLEHPKRIDMIIAAMQEVSSDIPLYIAGEGDDLARLKALAEPDPRIVFLGQVSEDALKQHYANALAVPFVPYDEDYGYITIEAMLSGKPVVTTLDAGGPTEFVVDGETGRVVAPEAKALGQALDDEPNRARSTAALEIPATFVAAF